MSKIKVKSIVFVITILISTLPFYGQNKQYTTLIFDNEKSYGNCVELTIDNEDLTIKSARISSECEEGGVKYKKREHWDNLKLISTQFMNDGKFNNKLTTGIIDYQIDYSKQLDYITVAMPGITTGYETLKREGLKTNDKDVSEASSEEPEISNESEYNEKVDIQPSETKTESSISSSDDDYKPSNIENYKVDKQSDKQNKDKYLIMISDMYNNSPILFWILVGLVILLLILIIRFFVKKGHYYGSVISDYATFTGRSTRSEYWYFILINGILVPFTIFLDNILGTTIGTMPYGFFYWSYMLIVMLPGTAVCIRRLHDVGKSGWFYLLNLIPIIGNIWYLVLVCTDSEPGDNEYGENPKNSECQTLGSENYYSYRKIRNYSCPKCGKPYIPNDNKQFCSNCGYKL